MNIKDIIPKDWQLVRLSEISELITKGTTPTTNGYSYLDEGINFVKVESIHANGNFIPKMFAHVGQDCHNSFKRSQLRLNDILFTIAGALGRSAIVTDAILPANTNQAVAIIRLKNVDYLNYIFHYLRGFYVKNLIEKINVSTAQANLSLGQVNQFEIPLPPLPEQQKIAEILSTVDAKIEVIDQQITETQTLKKGLMQRLLTKGIRHTEFKDSPLGMIPKSWEVVELSDIAKCTVGIATSTTHAYCENGVLLLRNQNIKEGKIALNDVLYITAEFDELNKSKRLEEDDIITVRTGYPGISAVVPKELAGSQSFTTLIIRRKSESLLSKFLCYYINSEKGKTFFQSNQAGGGQQNVGSKTLESMKIVVPTLSEQNQIVNILTSVDEKLEVLSEKKTHYQELKQGLMQQLLTGKIRVKIN